MALSWSQQSIRCLSLIFCFVGSLRSEFLSTEKVNCETVNLRLIACECHNSTSRRGIQVFCANNRNITSIPAKVERLATLKITGANIRLITEVIAYPDLTGLYLNEDQIRFIEDFSFANLSRLVDLSLANNELSSIGGNTFAGLSSLQLLVLTGNRLYVVRSDSFSGRNLPSLQILKLDRCSLYDIEPDSFPALSHLAILDIAYNSLQQLPVVGGEYGLSNLTHLNLSDNRLNEVDASFFAKVPSLTHLYLDRNNIRHVPSGSLRKSLTFISLRKNRIESLAQSDLSSSLPLLKFLDLSFNSLTKLNIAELPSSSFGGNLEKVLVHDNPWDCNECGNGRMFDESVVFRWNSEANVSCTTPREFSGLNVYRNRNKVFANCAPKSVAVPALVGIAVLVALLTLCMLAAFKLRVKHQRQKLVKKEELDSLTSSKEKLPSTLFAMPKYHKEREDEQSFL